MLTAGGESTPDARSRMYVFPRAAQRTGARALSRVDQGGQDAPAYLQWFAGRPMDRAGSRLVRA
jgi:hypothetical protein